MKEQQDKTLVELHPEESRTTQPGKRIVADLLEPIKNRKLARSQVLGKMICSTVLMAGLLVWACLSAQATSPGVAFSPAQSDAAPALTTAADCPDPLAILRTMTVVDVVFVGRHTFRRSDGTTHTNYQSVALSEGSSGPLDRADFGPAANPVWAGRTFSQHAEAQHVFGGQLVATLTLHGSGTIAADGRSLEALELAITPWYTVLPGVPATPVRSRKFVLAGPIPLTSCAADAVEFSVLGAAVPPRITQVIAINGNTASYSPVERYESTNWTAAPTPVLTVRFTGPAASVQGQVYAPIGYTDSNAGFPIAVQFSGRAPLAGVQVDLARMTEVGGSRTYTRLGSTTADEDGRYLFAGVPITDSLVISTTLRGADIRVLDASASPTNYASLPSPAKDVTVISAAFAVPSTGIVVQQDVAFDKAQAHTDPAAGSVAAERLDDLALIYYHAYQAFRLTQLVGLTLDTKPVPLYAYLREVSGAYWKGPFTSGANAGIPPHIVIGGKVTNKVAISSDATSSNRPDNREWHEFGHHVMYDALGNLFPNDPTPCSSPPGIGQDCNHWGYYNVSTTDSWTEGFAEFFSMVVNHEIAKDGTPAYLYRWGGSTTNGASNLETNFKAWRMRNGQSYEEFAVAGLLWDLLDGTADGDVSVLSRPGPGGTVVRATYADHVSMDLATLWSALTHNSGGAYGYIMTIRDLYDVLKAAGIGQKAAGPGGMTALDELFVAHGFFADTGPYQRFYDAGEVIGSSGYLTFTVAYTGTNGVPQVRTVPAQPARRSPPPVPDALVKVTPGNYTVSVRFEPPASYYDFSYNLSTSDGTLLLLVADADYAATVSVIPADSADYEPLVLTNDFLWNAPPDQDGIILTHTFERRRRPTYLPLVLRVQGPAVPPPTPTRTPTARPPTTTPTPTRTATPSVQSGIYGRLTYNGAAAGGLDLRLRFFDGWAYSTASTTQTDSQGRYRFAGAPSLAPGQSYYVRYGPNTSDQRYLSNWYGPSITSYTTGSDASGGDFDLANITLSAPAPGAIVSLPVTFVWQKRSVPGDTYRLVLFDPDNDDTWTTRDLGNVDRLTITSLPAGMVTGKRYGWYIEVWQGDASYGESYYYRSVTFTTAENRAGSALAAPGDAHWRRSQRTDQLKSEEDH
jgi:hypothetical protein